MFHCSFQNVGLLRRSPFRWRLLSIASDPATPPNAVLCLLAMCRQTRYPQQCLALMEYLYSEPVQTRFGRAFGNAPVLKKVAMNPRLISQHPFPDVYRETVQNSQIWPDDVLQKLTRCSALDLYFYNGEITVDEAIARLRFSLELAFPDTVWQ